MDGMNPRDEVHPVEVHHGGEAYHDDEVRDGAEQVVCNILRFLHPHTSRTNRASHCIERYSMATMIQEDDPQ